MQGIRENQISRVSGCIRNHDKIKDGRVESVRLKISFEKYKTWTNI